MHGLYRAFLPGANPITSQEQQQQQQQPAAEQQQQQH
jgi:hypothetical protein